MTETPAPTAESARTLVSIRSPGISTADITPQWMEDMVNRLFKEAKRQLSQIEGAKTGCDRESDEPTNDKNVGYRERNANTFVKLVNAARDLAQLQLELEKRGLIKQKKTVNARKSMERKLARLEIKK
ncbi:MAG TPA: hypothetical protein VHL34_02010 [Rhizomicrobium sp.]|jgi:hypothetical protein|nr:hypothetical protein [Rhizomicrobium sp.]